MIRKNIKTSEIIKRGALNQNNKDKNEENNSIKKLKIIKF